MNMRNRSFQPEMLDGVDIPFEDIRQNMVELETVNKLLGGHSINKKAIGYLMGKKNELVIYEIGSGGGDNLAAINNWAKRRGINVSCTGIDVNISCVRFASDRYPDIRFICNDYREHIFDQKPDIIFSSLFCHHFKDEDLIEQLHWMRHNCSLGFFINDLHRNIVAYHSIRLLSLLFSKSYLLKNDAPLSVARGFLREEWENLLKCAGINSAEIRWHWAFRWLVTFKHDNEPN